MSEPGFHFTADARARGFRLLPFGLLFAGLGAFLVFGVDTRWWTLALGAFAFVLSAPLVIGSAAWIAGGGRWEIELNDEGLSWSSPSPREPSFRIPLEAIERIESSGGGARVVLVERSGARHVLPRQSGVDLGRLVAALERMGVRIEG